MRGVAVLFLLAGCATNGLVPPSHGGRDWLELTTANFVVRTDLGERAAREQVNRLEALRSALLAAILPGATVRTGQLPVVVLRSGDEWWRIFRPSIASIMVDRVLWRPLILYSTAVAVQDMELIKHELTHYISRLYVRNAPPWMDEGVALFFQTAVVDGEAGTVAVGRPGKDNYTRVRQTMMPLEKVLSYIRAPEDQAFYATSWLLVHYLVNHEPERFAEYRRLLQSPQTAERAWEVAFADRPLAELEAALRDYVESGVYAESEGRFTVPRAAPRVRQLSEVEVRRVLAVLYLESVDIGPNDPMAEKVAAMQIADVLRMDPNDVEANALAVVLRNETGPALAERAQKLVAVHPESWLAWTLAAMAATTEAERAAAVSRVLALTRGDPSISLGRLAGPQ